MLIGRAAEMARVDALLSEVRSGGGSTLVIRGEAGSGKTALLTYAREQARELEVLQLTGSEFEADLPYGALHALLRPALELVERIPAAQGRALRAALGLDAPQHADRLTISAGVLNLLAEMGTAGPLAV